MKKYQVYFNLYNICTYINCYLITSSMLTEKFKNVDEALLPTWTSAATFKCSNRTSIVGRTIPTLTSYKKKEKEKNYYWKFIENKRPKTKTWHKVTCRCGPWAWTRISHDPLRGPSPTSPSNISFAWAQDHARRFRWLRHAALSVILCSIDCK